MSQDDHFITTAITAPFGSVGICLRDYQLYRITLHGEPADTSRTTSNQAPDLLALDLLHEIGQQLQDYFQQAHCRLSLPPLIQGTAFQQRVWQAIADIPLGETRTYSQLAAIVGSGPRAVANACGANPYPLLIPCHRVVASNGIGGFMQGHAQGLAIKRWLLLHESARFACEC